MGFQAAARSQAPPEAFQAGKVIDHPVALCQKKEFNFFSPKKSIPPCLFFPPAFLASSEPDFGGFERENSNTNMDSSRIGPGAK